MVRLVGIDLPRNKKVVYALTYIHGIGLTSAKKLVEIANINPDEKTKTILPGSSKAREVNITFKRKKGTKVSNCQVSKTDTTTAAKTIIMSCCVIL